MNHAGEIRPLTRLARPHVAIVTMVGPVHIEFFSSEEAIADAKAEVFEGLEPDGVAILNANNRHFARLAAAAKATGAARIIACGEAPDADARLVAMSADAEGSDVGATILGRDLRFRIGAPGAHYAQNAIAVLAAVAVVGADVAGAAAALAGISAPVGRGARGRYDLAGGPVLLIDESYNANPASVAAALAAMAATPRDEFPRRIAILGDMRELGQQSDVLHSALAPAIEAAGVDVLFAAGPHMAGLYAAVPPARRGAHAPEAAGLIDDVLAAVRAGDVVMVKGSLGSHMGPIVDALKSHLASAARGTLTSR